jgi:hypothetical protein
MRRSNVRPGPEEETISSIPKEPPDTKMYTMKNALSNGSGVCLSEISPVEGF